MKITDLQRARAYWLKNRLAFIARIGASLNQSFEQQVISGQWDNDNELQGYLSIVQSERAKSQVLMDALNRARNQFDMYRKSYLAKGTDDGCEKAATNHACMIMCDDAIAEWVASNV